ncbi:uncharacterized protein LOC141719401 [Apium graveolens]|uniref:uncharacterized protein LOC141719401 n=1 Tax=Apium graveolens TaxID=4045 RepID=UPI003D7B3B63
MEKYWIPKERDSLEYEVRIAKFLIYAEENYKNPKKIPFPCCKCVNFKKFPVKVIRGHMYENSFSLGYIDWIWHRSKAGRSSVGSTLPPHEEEQNADAFKVALEPASEAMDAGASQAVVVWEATFRNPGGNSGGDDYDKDSHDFKRFVTDAQQPLFEGSDCTKLDLVLKLYNWKARFGVSDSAFSDLLSTVDSFLPQDNALSHNAYEAKKTLSNLGLDYTKFHVCSNECVLYMSVNETASECPKCKLSHWKMFKSSAIAELLTWNSNQRIRDRQMGHPADSPSSRNIDYRWPAFESEP